MTQARYDKVIIIEQDNELTQIVAQRPEGVKIYNCKPATADDVLELLNNKDNGNTNN